MRLALLFMLGGIAMVSAQDLVSGTTGNIAVLQNPPALAIISNDGEVRIDWDQVEKTLADPSKVDPTTLAYARLMIAIRAGTWKPVQ